MLKNIFHDHFTLGVAQQLMYAECEHLKIAKFSGCN